MRPEVGIAKSLTSRCQEVKRKWTKEIEMLRRGRRPEAPGWEEAETRPLAGHLLLIPHQSLIAKQRGPVVKVSAREAPGSPPRAGDRHPVLWEREASRYLGKWGTERLSSPLVKTQDEAGRSPEKPKLDPIRGLPWKMAAFLLHPESLKASGWQRVTQHLGLCQTRLPSFHW